MEIKTEAGNEFSFPNLRAFSIVYIGEGEFTPSRVKIVDERFSVSRTISRDPFYVNAAQQAAAWLEEKGIHIIGYCEMEKGAGILISDNFLTSIK